MKPSERIKEIHLKLKNSSNTFDGLFGFDDTFNKAILDYLDEEYNKENEK